jgi:transposase
MSKKRTYKSYTQEFKEEAVALVTEQGYTVPKAAESLGIRTNQLYQWKQKIEQSKRDILLSEDEKGELVSLRKEVKQLRMEKEILKKASAFFAREMK